MRHVLAMVLLAGAVQTVTYEQTVANLGNADPNVRLRAVRMLRDAGFQEAAVPLASLVTDPEDRIQIEAIGAELSLFLAEKVSPKKRVGLVVEVRGQFLAEPVFAGWPTSTTGMAAPEAVLSGLRAAARDDNPRVAAEALYAFGAFAPDTPAASRGPLLAASARELAATIGVASPALRLAGVRVLGRTFTRRPGDGPVNEVVGDAIIAALNDRDQAIRLAAMRALGAMRYERAVQALTDLFQHYRRGPLAEAALDALAHIAHSSIGTLLAAQLAGGNADLKRISIEGLARIGGQGVGGIDVALERERDDRVLLAGHFASRMRSDGSLDPIIEALLRPRLRDQALGYIREIAATRPLGFAAHVKDPDPRIRLDVADALGLSQNPSALPMVEALRQDRDPDVVSAAARAVRRLNAAIAKSS